MMKFFNLPKQEATFLIVLKSHGINWKEVGNLLKQNTNKGHRLALNQMDAACVGVLCVCVCVCVLKRKTMRVELATKIERLEPAMKAFSSPIFYLFASRVRSAQS